MVHDPVPARLQDKTFQGKGKERAAPGAEGGRRRGVEGGQMLGMSGGCWGRFGVLLSRDECRK